MKKCLLLILLALLWVAYANCQNPTTYTSTYVNSTLDTVTVKLVVTATTKLDTVSTTTIKKYQQPVPVPPFPAPSGASFVVPVIPFSDPEIYGASRGMNNFQNEQTFTYPSSYNYFRLTWAQVQTSATTFDYSVIDSYLKAAFQSGQQIGFRFGIVDNSTREGYITINGVKSCYPLFVHNSMTGGPVTDWNDGTAWYPDWNNPAFLSAWEAFLKAVAQHCINSPYWPAVWSVDIGGYGNYRGEWHMYGIDQAGHNTVPTDASLKRILDAHKVFPCWLINNVDMYDPKNVSPAFTYYAITSTNVKGNFGNRSDHLANLGTMNYDTVIANVTYNGVNFKNYLKNLYLIAPLLGEPMPDTNAVKSSGGTPYQNLYKDVQWYKLSFYSNVSSSSSKASQNNFMIASKLTGYRLQIDSGRYTSNSGGMNVTLSISNKGISPTYDDYVFALELRSGSSVVWSGKSSFTAKLFPPGAAVVTDNFSGVPTGNYSLYVTAKDVNNYKKPLSLANKNRGSDGSYLLTSVIIK